MAHGGFRHTFLFKLKESPRLRDLFSSLRTGRVSLNGINNMASAMVKAAAMGMAVRMALGAEVSCV